MRPLPKRNVRRALFRATLRWPPRGAGPPDFIGVGALGAGCTWWHRMLLRHPDVDRLRWRVKQLHFFDEFCARPMEDADVARYHRSFRRRRRGMLSGEWTPRYMYDVWTPPLIARAAPEAKLLVMVSDPIERYRLKLARELLRGAPDDVYRRMDDVSQRGRYASQLRALHEFCGEDRVLVLQHEKCLVDPLAQYARTLRFLGLRDDFQPPRLKRRQARLDAPRRPQQSGERRRPLLRRVTGRLPGVEPAELWPDIEESLHAELDPEVEALREMAPELDLALWPNFAHLTAGGAAEAAATAAAPGPPPPAR